MSDVAYLSGRAARGDGRRLGANALGDGRRLSGCHLFPPPHPLGSTERSITAVGEVRRARG